MTIFITDDKVNKIKITAHQLLQLRQPKIRQMAVLIGIMVAYAPAVIYGIWLTVAHIPDTQSTIADSKNRKFLDHLEWSLNTNIFQFICNKWGSPEFSSRNNGKVTKCLLAPRTRIMENQCILTFME